LRLLKSKTLAQTWVIMVVTTDHHPRRKPYHHLGTWDIAPGRAGHLVAVRRMVFHDIETVSVFFMICNQGPYLRQNSGTKRTMTV